jgi:hypothetical protein
MKKASQNIVTTLALLTMMAAGINFVKAQTSVKPPNQSMSSNATTAPPNVAQLQATANQAAAKIQSSPSDRSALVNAVITKSVDKATPLLLKNGFTAKQLQGAKIEFVNKTGGAGGAGGAGGGNGGTASKVKVTIHVDCCPLTITITIYL